MSSNKITDQNSVSLDKYFSQGLSGITTAKQPGDFKAFKPGSFLETLKGVEQSKVRQHLEVLLHSPALADYVREHLQKRLLDNEGFSTVEYTQIIDSLALSLQKQAKACPPDSQKFKILTAASRLARELEKGRHQLKDGLSALLPA